MILATLGLTLLHFLWQGALIALALAVVRRGFGNATPETRHGIACAALTAMAIVPLVTAFVVAGAVRPDAATTTIAPITPQTPSPRGFGWVATWVPLAWGIGVGILALRSTGTWIRLRRLLRDHTSTLDASWQARVARLSARIGLPTVARVLASDRVSSAIVVGCLRPVVLVPVTAFTGLAPLELEALILHELAHIRRRDPWFHRLQLVLETMLFYHPAVWWVSRVVHVEREFCCDAAVVTLTGDRIGYARALTGLEALRTGFSRQVLASTGGSLMTRIRRILNPRSIAPTTPWPAALSGVAALALVVTLLATTSAIGDPSRVAGAIEWMPDVIRTWQAEFDAAAREHGVDAGLLEIMTLVESRGNADVVSDYGAVGLMQVMPATANEIARERGIDEFDLADPATNIDFGAWYLARQMADFGDGTLSDETVALAVAAYNAGPRRIHLHLDEGEPLPDEARVYSRMVMELWRDRDDPTSAAMDRMRRKASF